MVTIPYDRNLKLEKLLLEKSLEWWDNHIVKNVVPKPSSVADINKYTRINPDSTMEATKDMQARIEKIKELKIEEKELQKKVEKLQTQVKLDMGENQFLMTKEGEVLATLKEINSVRVDAERLRQDKIFDDYCKEVHYKRLRV